MFFFIKGAPRSASKLSIDPIKRSASYFRKCTMYNKRTVPDKRTVSCDWNRRVEAIIKILRAKKWKSILSNLSKDLHLTQFCLHYHNLTLGDVTSEVFTIFLLIFLNVGTEFQHGSSSGSSASFNSCSGVSGVGGGTGMTISTSTAASSRHSLPNLDPEDPEVRVWASYVLKMFGPSNTSWDSWMASLIVIVSILGQILSYAW